MVKFYKYLNETEIISSDIWENMVKDCKTFLKDVKRNKIFLYSGRRGGTSSIFIKRIRKDRKPLDTPEEIHNKLDNAFQREFGVKARSGAMFTKITSDVGYYGDPYFVIPKGNNYKIIASDEVADLFLDLKNMTFDKLGIGKQETFGNIHKWINKHGYLYKDVIYIEIPSRVSSDRTHEYEKIELQQFNKALDESIEHLVNTYDIYKNLNNIDVSKYMDRELMVVCDEVYMIYFKSIGREDFLNWIEKNI